MDIDNMLNTKGQAVASAHFNRHLAQQAVMDSRTSDAGSDAGHPSHVGQAPHMYQTTSHPLHPMSNVPQMRYQSPSQPLQSMQMLPTSYMQENHPDQSYVNAPPAPASAVGSTGGPVGEAAPKQFHCSTCSKGFARRSDLARHERIHSGIRPHVCDWAGCGKQFIQRSALTVHSRVHTGEKPHMCERCGKPFSDSSSLARHRRIHSGKRPYKCPYANCQKTFTRRTTLTRHQNHHTGTIEDAAKETEAQLRQQKERAGRPSDGAYSETGSVHSTPSPSQRPHSMSPGSELPPINMHHPVNDYYNAMANGSMNGSIPPHLREYQQPSPRVSPATSPSLSSYSAGHHGRPAMTSHPTSYGPPQPLEPPTNGDNRGGSVGGSPHMTNMGWASPSHASMHSPASAEYAYPEPTGGYAQAVNVSQHQLYFPGSKLRRPQSTEPDMYHDTKPRMNEVWSTPVL